MIYEVDIKNIICPDEIPCEILLVITHLTTLKRLLNKMLEKLL